MSPDRASAPHGRQSVPAQLATNSSEHSASLQQRRRGVAEEQLFAGPPSDAHDDQIVLAALGLALRMASSAALSAQHRGADAHVVAVGDGDDVLEDRFFVAARAHAAASCRLLPTAT